MDPRTPDRPDDVRAACSSLCAAPCADASSASPSGPTRRRVLALAAVAGAGGAVLAACGGGGGGTSTSSTADPGSAAGTLVATSKVPVKGGVILAGPEIVVTQPTAGTFKAFTAICTHMSCTVGSVADNVISCPCHGSAFSAEDGSVRNGPATSPLAAIPITVKGGAVVKT